MIRTTRALAFVGSSIACVAFGPTAAAQQAASASGAPPRMMPNVDVSRPGPQAFSVALVLGDMQTAAAQDNVPTAARKALADMKDFLPFKSYRLLDAQWTLCCGRSAVVSRLRGPEEQDYDLELSPSPVDNRGKLYVRFILRDPAAGDAGGRVESSTAAESESLIAQRRAIEAQLADLRRRYNDNHPKVAESRKQLSDLEQKLSQLNRRTELARRGLLPQGATGRSRTIIDTSFAMEVGETVVVGTSRLKGDKALIALLTAVPPRSATNAR